jgi:hypothetical protein
VDATVYANESATILAACTLDSMQVRNYIYNSTTAIAVQLYHNGAAQSSFKCSTAASLAASCTVTGQSVAVAAGDTIALQISNASGDNGFAYVALHCH